MDVSWKARQASLLRDFHSPRLQSQVRYDLLAQKILINKPKCNVYEWLTCVLTAKILKYDGKQCCLIIYMVRINLPICGVDSPDGSVDVPLRYEVKYRGTFNLRGQIFSRYHVSQIYSDSDSENLSSALQSLNPSSLKRYLSFPPP